MISLCLITGNCAEYITRCLESFAPLADEICVVRAIGAAKPDNSLDLAAKFGARTGEYLNAPQNRSWPHVDNFAAARQQAFAMASHDYIFWCDTDDVLQSGAQVARELAAAGEYPCFIFPYEIFGQHVTVPRERLLRKGTGKWINPVHEFYQFNEAVEGYRDDRVVVRHLPHLNKHGSVDRNLKIIQAIPEKEMTPGMRYQLHCELLGAGRKAEAFEAAQKALTMGGLGRPETYQLLIHLATFSKDPHTIESYLIAAYQTDPCRREALGLLAGHMIDYGQPPKALAFARQMLATAPPAEESWNDRRSAYGWLGLDIMQQALRANNQFAEADRIRLDLLRQSGGPSISLIHATRGRPQRAATARKLWLDLAENPGAIEHIFVLDEDDDASHALRRMHHLAIPPGGGCVAAWNAGAALSGGQILVQMSDDWLPPPRWDKLILEKVESRKEKVESGAFPPLVIAVSDGHRTDSLLCMAIMTRAYYEQDWFMFHPDFTGVYSDNYFTEVAYRRGQVIDARELVFQHEHPAFNKKVAVDATYAAQNDPARYAQGAAVYDRLSVPGSDWSHIPGFFNYWPFYKEIAGRLQDGDLVAEVGVWLGRSIVYLAQTLQRLGRNGVALLAVDTFAGESGQAEHAATVRANGGSNRAEFERNVQLAGVEGMITTIQAESVPAAEGIADGALAFCFIDAAHDYDSVKADIAAWAPKVRPLGILAGHDILHEPVRRAVLENYPQATILGPVWFVKV